MAVDRVSFSSDILRNKPTNKAIYILKLPLSFTERIK